MTDPTADDLTAQANALYQQALALRRVEEQAITEATWQAAGEKADAYWDLLDTERPTARRRDQWLAIHAQKVAGGAAPPSPPVRPWTLYTATDLALAACDLADAGGRYEAAAGALSDLAKRSGLPADVLADCLEELEGLRSP